MNNFGYYAGLSLLILVATIPFTMSLVLEPNKAEILQEKRASLQLLIDNRESFGTTVQDKIDEAALDLIESME